MNIEEIKDSVTGIEFGLKADKSDKLKLKAAYDQNQRELAYFEKNDSGTMQELEHQAKLSQYGSFLREAILASEGKLNHERHKNAL